MFNEIRKKSSKAIYTLGLSILCIVLTNFAVMPNLVVNAQVTKEIVSNLSIKPGADANSKLLTIKQANKTTQVNFTCFAGARTVYTDVIRFANNSNYTHPYKLNINASEINYDKNFKATLSFFILGNVNNEIFKINFTGQNSVITKTNQLINTNEIQIGMIVDCDNNSKSGNKANFKLVF